MLPTKRDNLPDRDIATAPAPRLKVGFILARSFTLSAFALFVDTLRLASDTDDKSGRVLADWHVLGSTRHLITSSCGVQVAPTSDFVDPSEFNYIVVVGGLLSQKAPVDDETMNYLRRAAAQNVTLIGLCTGTFILAAAGLMKRHQTCVSWLHYQAFRDQFPGHVANAERLFNLDHKRGSCVGGSSSADMAASLVRRHIGRDAERNAMEVLQIDRARSAHDIQPRRPLSIKCEDSRLQSALLMMEHHVENILSMSEIATAVGVSRRQLERLFRINTNSSPAHVYKKIRMERARNLVLHSKASLLEIALEVGFNNNPAFSKQFRSEFGQSPTQFRAQKQGNQVSTPAI